MFIHASALDSSERPTFWVGAAGFGTPDIQRLSSCLQRADAAIDWHLSGLRNADAWIVNGSRCTLLLESTLRVAPGGTDDTPLILELASVDRPIAFAHPVPANVEPLCTLNAESPDSVRRVLLDFDAWMLFGRAQFVLGAHVVQLGTSLRHGVFHVSFRDRLLAVLDFRQGTGAVSPHMRPQDVERAVWSRRPESAGGVPEGFVQTSAPQLSWQYARRSQRELLPARYRTETIYYRRAPRVPAAWLSDTHLVLMKELASASATFGELQRRSGLSEPQLERDLACLFHAGAVTTTAGKAIPRPRSADADSASDSIMSVQSDGASPLAPRIDPTVPASLDPQFARVRKR
jgi:hypothetical protein